MLIVVLLWMMEGSTYSSVTLRKSWLRNDIPSLSWECFQSYCIGVITGDLHWPAAGEKNHKYESPAGEKIIKMSSKTHTQRVSELFQRLRIGQIFLGGWRPPAPLPPGTVPWPPGNSPLRGVGPWPPGNSSRGVPPGNTFFRPWPPGEQQGTPREHFFFIFSWFLYCFWRFHAFLSAPKHVF